jgi:pseudoazurin
MHRRTFIVAASAGAALALTGPAKAAEHEVHMLNSGAAGAMVFEPSALKIAVGDSVKFIPTDQGHNAETIAEMLPAGAEAFKSKINEEYTATFTVSGVYGIKCTPHYVMGMVMLVVVGDDLSNLDAAKAAKVPPKAGERFTAGYTELGL